MSTFTGVGPALNLDGPLPAPPPYRLLAAPGVQREAQGRELNGVNVWGYPEGTPGLWEPCSNRDGTFATKEDDSDWQIPRFDALVAYFPISCSTITAAPEEFARRAEVALDATLSFAVAQALSEGALGSTNPYFGDTNLTQLGGGTVTAQVGLNYLENAIGETGRQGMIHATPGIVSAWNFVDLVTRAEGSDFLRTANGTLVVSDGGYIGVDPTGKVGSTPSSGLEWAFATGPVEVYTAPGPRPAPKEYIDRSINEITYRAEEYFLALWDTSLQVGTLIDWTP